MKPAEVFEDEKELNHRLIVVGKLSNLVKEWSPELGKSKNLPPSAAANTGGKPFTLGSTSLECTLKVLTETFFVSLLYFFQSFFEQQNIRRK